MMRGRPDEGGGGVDRETDVADSGDHMLAALLSNASCRQIMRGYLAVCSTHI